MNNPYPTLSPQSIQPYPTIPGPSNHLYHKAPITEPITLGVPLLHSQVPQLTTQSVPVPPSTQMAYAYNHLPQQQSSTATLGYYAQGYQVQRTNSNVRDQNAGYIELTDKVPSEPSYAPLAITNKADMTMVNEPSMPGMLYPQLPGPMASPYLQLQTPNMSGNGPIVYDMNLLHGITSREPQLAHCPHCNKHVQTIVNYKAGKGAMLSGLFMGCMGGVPLLCSWVPCVLKDFKDAIHYCPVCGSVVGKKKFLVNS